MNEFIFIANLLTLGYDIIDMVNKYAAPKCQTGYTASTENCLLSISL